MKTLDFLECRVFTSATRGTVRYKDIKRGIAKPLEDYLGQTHL